MLRKPTGGTLGGQFAMPGGEEDGNAKLGFDGVQQPTDGVGMNFGLNFVRVPSTLEVFVRRFDQDGLPSQ